MLAVFTGLILIYLAVEGPLFLHHIRYKRADVVNNQLVAQDFVNMFQLSPLLIAGGILITISRDLFK